MIEKGRDCRKDSALLEPVEPSSEANETVATASKPCRPRGGSPGRAMSSEMDRVGTTDIVRPADRVGRSLGERLLRRATYLRGSDRQLLQDTFGRGLTVGEIAAQRGLHHATVQRRVRRLVRHLSSDRFSYVMVHVSAWPEERARIARLRYLQRRSLREVAREAGVSMYRVRAHCRAVESEMDGWS